jgi:hypothetical protein
MKRSGYWLIGVCLLAILLIFLARPVFVFGDGLAPTIVVSGDDALTDGGNNDPYDSLIILNLNNTSNQFNSYKLEYSADAGQNWSNIDAQAKIISANNYKYYWSTSMLPPGVIKIRTSYNYGEPLSQSQFSYVDVEIKHEASGRRASYFVDDFATTSWANLENIINVDWLGNGRLRLKNSNSGLVSSVNLAPISSGAILSVAVQPVLSDLAVDQSIRFQISNNGNQWYGSSGINSYITFSGPTPAAKTINLSASGGDNKLYWRAIFNKTSSDTWPELYKLRLQWEANGQPIACFTFSPQTSSNPNQFFSFNASCSSDYNPGGGLNYSWSMDNGESYTPYYTNKTISNVFGTTSLATVKLRVRDGYDAIGETSDIVNSPGVQDSIYGWSWNENYGWTSLNCDNVYYGENVDLCSQSNYKVSMNRDRTISGWAWNSNLGWICFGSSCSGYGFTPDNEHPFARYEMANGNVTGWARYIVYQSSPLSEQGWLKLRGNKIDGEPWCGINGKNCVHLDFANKGMSGWAWGSASSNGDLIGPGWENFKGVINTPWFESKFSSIYGLSKLGGENQFTPPVNNYSASYCIWSEGKNNTGTITNLSSQSGCLQENYSGSAKFPSATNKYQTTDGLLDINSLIAQAQKSNTVYTNSNVGSVLNASRPLANQVYYFHNAAGDYYIDDELMFYNGRSKNTNGAGTIVIDGNLIISNNIRYENSAIEFTKNNLASVAFIVFGDIIIDPQVETTAGVFLALGKVSQQSCNPVADGCGRFVSGDDGAEPLKLTVTGLVFARKFLLQRTFKQNNQPAESFVYDGRVSINTPPGLGNLAKGLPKWREAFSQP